MNRYNIYSYPDKRGVQCVIHGTFKGEQLLDIAYETMRLEAQSYFCPYCHNKFGTGHKIDCDYLFPEFGLDFSNDMW